MSWHQENTIWQSADGTWSRGFYVGTPSGDPTDPEYDEEWDVEWDETRFNWVSTGHSTEQKAYASWVGANPGGHSVLPYSKGSADEAARLDLMVLALRDPAAAVKVSERNDHTAAARAFAALGLGEGSRVTVVVSTRKGKYAIRDRHTGVLVKDGSGALTVTDAGAGSKAVAVTTSTGRLSSKVVEVAKADPPRRSYGWAPRW